MTCYILIATAMGYVYQPVACPHTIAPPRPVPEYHQHHSGCGCHQQHRQKRKPDWSWRKRWTFRLDF